MPLTAIPSFQTSSQLIQQLHKLAVLGGKASHSRFVTTLGRFIDFSEAFSLSDFLSNLPNTKASANSAGQDDGLAGAAGAKERYIKARGEMMLLIVHSFITDNCPVSLRLPLMGDATFSLEDQGLRAYQRFYALHQSEMESGTLKLQGQIRRYLSASSPSLAQLALLDTKLSEVLTRYSRDCLKVVPSLLAKRFEHLCGESSQAISDEAQNTENVNSSNLQRFLVEMQSLLLAELEIRLQPTLGMIEALTLDDIKEEENTP